MRERIEQTPIEEPGSCEVLVVGAGPAGALAAGLLARRGREVLLIDRARFPREKVCGDGLNHDSVRVLREVGLHQRVVACSHESPAARVYSASGIWVEVPGPFYSLERARFDHLLAAWAVEGGARFSQAQVEGIAPPRNGTPVRVRLRGVEGEFLAEWVVIATGARISAGRTAGLVEAESGPGAVALRGYISSRSPLSRLVGSFHRSVLPGYGWVFPLGGGRFNAGVIAHYRRGRRQGARLQQRLDRFAREFEPLRELLECGEWVSRPRGAPLRTGLRRACRPARGRLLSIGEALGSTLPLTGEGIGKALETAVLAAEALDGAGGPEEVAREYTAAIDRRLRPRYRSFSIAERLMASARLGDFAARRIRRESFLQQALEQWVTEERSPRQVLSARGFAAMLRP